jgi:hypothetical protein
MMKLTLYRWSAPHAQFLVPLIFFRKNYNLANTVDDVEALKTIKSQGYAWLMMSTGTQQKIHNRKLKESIPFLETEGPVV